MKHARLLLLSLALAAPAPGPALAAQDCRVPSELLEDDPTLPLVAERLKHKEPITIVAIGGATTAGAAAANPAQSYPHRLEVLLRQRHPGVAITVLNKGVARDTAEDMVERFPRDVFAPAPTLVIWETGTFDAARGIDPDIFANALETGIAALRQHKVDIVLMNMQYSRVTDAIIDFGPYLDAMDQRADIDDVYLFRRFEMMRYWSENGIFQFADAPREQRAELAAEVYDCLAQRLVDAIDYAAR